MYAESQPSTAGILSRPYFSALGGWGYQKAIFRGGLFTVISDTSMGRTSYYSVEFKGRIGVFWNVAKLVLVYQRTVAPSEQFASVTGASAQDPLLGRPIIRLVEMYVEILEPVRSYPDFGANPTTNGFVQSIEFKSKKIRVDPAWVVNAGSGAVAVATLKAGGSVGPINVTNGGTGYKTAPIVVLVGGHGSGATAEAVVKNGVVTAINPTNGGQGYQVPPVVAILPATFSVPLWQSAQDLSPKPPLDPGLYPKPQVAARHSSPQGSGSQNHPHEFSEPNKLFFYTDQTQKNPDTNSWPPVQDIDYPAAHTKTPPVVSPLAPNPDDPLVDNPFVPGSTTDTDFKPYTFQLNNGSVPTDLGFSRIESAISAAVDSISMVRATLATMGDLLTADDDDNTLNPLQLLYAYGDPPNVNGLKLNRDKLTYYFDQFQKAVSITPSGAMLNNLLSDPPQLKGIGVRLPTNQLLDNFVPLEDVLDNMDFSTLIPNIAGLNLSQLLPDLKMPAGLGNHVKITHAFDTQTERGWVQADIDIPIAGPTTLFSAGPVQLTIENIEFTATVRVEAGATGAPQQNFHGSITADWDLQLCGQPIVTFEQTSLSFDQTGKTTFNLSPAKVKLNGVLQLLSDALNSPGSSDDDEDEEDGDDGGPGFTPHLVQANGLPVSVQAILEIPLPDIAFGVCALSNLDFGASFGLEIKDLPDFALSTSVHVGDETAPCALIIFILGGCFYMKAQARYLPFKRRVSTDLVIGLGVGAELEIAFGPVKGVIFAFLIVSGELHFAGDGSGASLTITVSLVLGGAVDVAGLITVNITLLLELQYANQPSSSLIGTGTLSISVKICWLLTINFSYTVQRRIEQLGSGARPLAAGPDPYLQVAQQYLGTLV